MFWKSLKILWKEYDKMWSLLAMYKNLTYLDSLTGFWWQILRCRVRSSWYALCATVKIKFVVHNDVEIFDGLWIDSSRFDENFVQGWGSRDVGIFLKGEEWTKMMICFRLFWQRQILMTLWLLKFDLMIVRWFWFRYLSRQMHYDLNSNSALSQTSQKTTSLLHIFNDSDFNFWHQKYNLT